MPAARNVSGMADSNEYTLPGILQSLKPRRPARAGAQALQPRLFACDDLWRGSAPLLDTLQNIYGDRPLDSLGGSYGWSVRYRQVEDYAGLKVNNLGDYIDAFKTGTTRLPYLRHLSLNRALPEIRQFIHDPDEFKPNWVSHPVFDRLGGPELFIGQAGTVFGNFHQDQAAVQVGFVQLQGEKEIILLPPENGKYLYTFAGRQFPFEPRNSELRYDDLTNFDKFPLARHLKPIKIVLRAGQALMLPADWWHTTRNLSDSISYNIRIVNSRNAATTVWRHIQGMPRLLARSFR